jgi:hypothetical protein
MTEQTPPSLEEAVQQFSEALQPLMNALIEFGHTMVDVLEDLGRDNAYHPNGPVVRSTATPIIDDPEKLIEAPEEEKQP